MSNPSGGGRGALSEPIISIDDHGVISHLTVPPGFVPIDVSEDKRWNNYCEYKVLGSTARICYEQSSQPISGEDESEMAKLFSEQVSNERTLNIYGEDEPDDSGIYTALCMCFVFGGFLVRDGACLDLDSSKWMIRHFRQNGTMLVGHLKFQGSNGKTSKREALLVVPKAPDAQGTGYIWLEGTADEIDKHRVQFLSALEEGEFRNLEHSDLG